MSPRVQQLLAFGLPGFCLVGAGLVVLPSWRQLDNDRQALVRVRAEIADAEQNVALMSRAPKGPPFAHVPATRNEPIAFLQHLNEVSAECGVRLVQYKLINDASQANNGAPNPAGETKSGLPPGITAAALRLTVEGHYPNVALFFGRLESYPRLVSITEVTMRAAKLPLISADFTLTRYTTPVSAP